MRSIRRRLLTVAVATGAVALAAPLSGASAVVVPPVGLPFGGGAMGAIQGGSGGCAGTVRPSLGGNTGSSSAQTCGALMVFNGPQIGQVSNVMGPTIIGFALSPVIVSGGSAQLVQ